jgi:hypothetical protein
MASGTLVPKARLKGLTHVAFNNPIMRSSNIYLKRGFESPGLLLGAGLRRARGRWAPAPAVGSGRREVRFPLTKARKQFKRSYKTNV